MCMAAGIEPPEEIFVHGYLLIGGEKLGKTMIASGVAGTGADAKELKITDVSPLALAEDFGVDPFRYHLLRDVALGGDGDFSYEGIVARYNADLANNLGNLVSRVTTVVHSKCDGIGPAPDPIERAGAGGGGGPRAVTSAWARWAPHDALEATWRLIGATNAELEATEPWKMEPGPGGRRRPRRRARGPAHRGDPRGAGHAVDGGRGLAPHRPGGRPRRSRLPGAASWGGYPGGAAVEKGEPLFPRRKA